MADIRLAIQVDSKGAISSVKQFNDEVDKVPAAANRADGAVGTLKKQFDKFIAGVSIGVGIAVVAKSFDALVGAAGRATSALLSYSDKMVTLRQRTDQSLQSLQVFNAIAKTSGTSVEVIAKSATVMSAAIGKGDDAFRKMGLSVSALKLMSPDQAFAKVAQTIGSIENPMERAAAAVSVFGKRAAELLPMFTSNVEDAAKKARELGLVLDDDILNSSEALGDSVDLAGMSFDAFLMRMGGVISQSPAVMAAVNDIGRMFGELSGWIDKNKATLISYTNDAVFVAADAIVFLTGSLRALMLMLQAASGPAGWMDIGGMFAKVDAIMASLNTRAKTFRDTIGSAVKDMGGAGVLLPGGKMLPQSKGGGGFFNQSAGKTEIKIQELKIPSMPNMWMDLFGGGSQGKFGTLQGGSKTYDFWGDKSKFLPSQLDGNIHVTGAKTAEAKASMTAAQALQNLANVASLSGSKLGKAIAGIAGGGAGLASGIGALAGLKGQTGITGILGKVGVYGQIAASALSIGSSLFGLFKKKPKEPPPEPPKKATAEAWRSFTGDQLSKGASGVLAGVSGIKVTTAADMASQGLIASSIFWQTFKEKGILAAAEAFRPVRDKMMETFKAAGADDGAINALLGPMSQQIDLAGNESFKGAAEGSKGFADALAAMANTQMPMTIDQFKAFELQAVNGFEQMKQAAIDQGLSMEEAIRSAALGSGQMLTTLKDAASKYGFDLGGSQALFDEAQKAGVAFTGDSQERLIMSIDRLTETLGGAPPKFEQAFAAGGTAAGQNLGAAAAGDSRGFNGDTIGTAIAAKLSGALDRFSGVLGDIADRPIEVYNNVMLDGDAIASGVADAVDRGNTRLVTALEGR